MYNIRKIVPALIALHLITGTAFIAVAQPPQQWETEFKNPPKEAHPRTWWHWTQSNVSKEGITKDLEWMKRSGIAGFMLADVASGSGQTVDKKLVYGTPEWKDAVRFAAAEADRLGLEMSIFSSPGWSLTGGPWVKPEQAMKKLVWSETQINGGVPFTGKLPQPPSQEGAGPLLANTPMRPGAPHFYADCAVIAYRTPPDQAATEVAKPMASTLTGTADINALTDDNLMTGVSIKAGADKVAWLQLEYDHPILARSITIAGARGIPYGRVMAGNDKRSLHILTTIPGKSGYRGGNIRTYAFPETRAKYFRIELTNDPVKPGEVISQVTTLVDSVYTLSEVRLHADGRVNRWEDKAGFNFLFEYSGVSTPAIPAGGQIDKAAVIDLTSKLQADGSLKWTPPLGNWTVMRFGYALTGAKNRPTVPAASGYEVDKMSKKHVTEYMQDYTRLIKESAGSEYGKSLKYMMMDSWEAGIQNWTDDMISDFKKRRGYDPTPYMPVLAGRIVGSSSESDRFLWDFRRTLVDLIAENHYGTVTDFLNKQGLKTYSEAGGVSLESIEDALLNKKYVNIPMGEFWVKDLHPSSMYYEDMRGAASAAHVYGSKIVAAEAFTGGNYESPARLKQIADYWFSQGLNQLVFHTSAHQPLDTKPGNTMVGTHINRNITWADNAEPFVTYLSRCSYLLQKGKYVADIAYLLNEGAPSTMPFWGGGLQPSKPDGYEFDYINADVLLNLMTVDANGRLNLPGGMSYAVLVLPPTQQMSLPVLRKIRQLVEAGATVVGPKPLSSPSLSAGSEGDIELTDLSYLLWADLDGISRTTRTFGKGRIYWGTQLKDVLKDINVPRDITIDRLPEEVAWTHRRDGNIDIYYVVNRTDAVQDLNIAFRTAGKNVNLWNPEEGTSTPAAYTIAGDFTHVPLHLEAGQNMFIVFSGNATTASRNVPAKAITQLATISGNWQLSFPPKSGAPATVLLPALSDWTSNKDEGIKYFSGTATYSKTINIKQGWIKPGSPIWIDLGKVGDMAEVWLNGKKAGLVWFAPYRLDISKYLKPGNNKLEIKVTNEWTNRLIGDNANSDHKVLDAYIRPFGGAYTLSVSGLIGPVRLISR